MAFDNLKCGHQLRLRQALIENGQNSTARYIRFGVINSSIHLNYVDPGGEIDPVLLTFPAGAGYFFTSKNTVGQTNYTYESSSKMKINGEYFIPICTSGGAFATPIYGYMKVTNSPLKVVISKMVFKSVGVLKAGD